ncbi:MAG: DUF4493 domain-containing protein [Bacteroidales bacterium]|nr:DUF4493 domain-containing protein [Bacteroidales bacterium]
MRKKILFLMLLPVLAACGELGRDQFGELRISFDDAAVGITRSGHEIPDTSEFILYVTDATGNVVYEGKYGDSPESMMVDAGSYNVKAVSCEFRKPAFSLPQFGDEQCVVVPEGGVVNVRLLCRQMNAGIRLDISHGFLTAFPSSALRLKSDDGSLTYSYNEKRIAYFRPGNVSLVMTEGANDEVLMTRRMEAQEILTLTISAASDSGSEIASSGVSMVIDTSRYWIDESFVIGGSNGKGESEAMPLTVSQAKASVGEEDIWVSGYVVGGDLTSASASFEPPFSSMTNLLLGSRTSTSDKEACIAVQLPSGSVRDMVNLVDNPHLLGKKVSFKGDIVEAYFGITGLKNVSECKIY